MLYHSLDGVAGRSQIFTRVEFGGTLDEESSYLSGHGKSQIGVDVDLADTVLGGFSDHLFGHSLCAGDLSAVFIVPRIYTFSGTPN